MYRKHLMQVKNMKFIVTRNDIGRYM